MNSVHLTTAARQPDFVVALQAAEISPYLLGALDAERGELCLPELYFAWVGKKLEYIEGFEAVAGETLLSAQAKRLLGLIQPAPYALVLDNHVMGFDSYEEAAAEIEGLRRDLIASGYRPVAGKPSRLERLAPDGTISHFTAFLLAHKSNGDLDTTIDAYDAAETADYEDDLADIEFWRQGC